MTFVGMFPSAGAILDMEFGFDQQRTVLSLKVKERYQVVVRALEMVLLTELLPLFHDLLKTEMYNCLSTMQ